MSTVYRTSPATVEVDGTSSTVQVLVADQGPVGPQGPTGAPGAGVQFRGEDTWANISAIPDPVQGDAWVLTDATGAPDRGDGTSAQVLDWVVYDLSVWVNTGSRAGPSIPSGDADNRLTVGTDNLLYSAPAEPPITKNTAFNKNFGAAADTVTEGDDDRLIKLESAADFLQLAATDSLVTQTLYWVPDATFDRPLYMYATGPDTYEVVQPAGEMIRDTRMLGHALVVDDYAGVQHGLISATSDPFTGIAVVGTDRLNPAGPEDATMPVNVYGSEILLRSPTVKMTLSGAEVGSPLVVTNVIADSDGDIALLGAAPAPVPEFSVTGTSQADVELTDGGGWIETQTQISGLAQEVPVGATADYQLYISNNGMAPGVVTVGFQVEDAVGDPGNWVQAPAQIQLPTISIGGKSLYTGFMKTQTALPLGANIRMVASAVGAPADVTAGSWTHAANTLGAVDPQTFRTNNQKPTSVNTFRLSVTNGAGQDVGDSLLDIEIGSTFVARRAIGSTSYTVTSVDAFNTTGVDIGVTGGSGNDTNWSGDVTFDVRLGSGAFAPNVLGSVSDTTISLTVAGSGGGGGEGTISNLGVSYTSDNVNITNTGGADASIPPALAGTRPGPITAADQAKLDAAVNADLGVAYDTVNIDVTNTAGTDAKLLPAVAAGNSGLMTGADKTRIDGMLLSQVLTQTEYDALSPPDPGTTYHIREDGCTP